MGGVSQHRRLQADTLRQYRRFYRAAVAAGPIETTTYCEDCNDEHTETHYAPEADALRAVWSPLHTLALARRFEGAILSRSVARLIARAEAGGARMDMTPGETMAALGATLDGIAQALGAPLPSFSA